MNKDMKIVHQTTSVNFVLNHFLLLIRLMEALLTICRMILRLVYIELSSRVVGSLQHFRNRLSSDCE